MFGIENIFLGKEMPKENKVPEEGVEGMTDIVGVFRDKD